MILCIPRIAMVWAASWTALSVPRSARVLVPSGANGLLQDGAHLRGSFLACYVAALLLHAAAAPPPVRGALSHGLTLCRGNKKLFIPPDCARKELQSADYLRR